MPTKKSSSRKSTSGKAPKVTTSKRKSGDQGINTPKGKR